jgi:hypothetical protein
MARARHVGKVVLTHAESAVRNAAFEFHGAHAAFVIAGGTGGLGLATAEWLVGRGAKKIALVGRRAPSPAARERIGDMQKSGARVETYAADVACFGEIENVFERIQAELGPVRGVIHAAGAIEDAVLGARGPPLSTASGPQGRRRVEPASPDARLDSISSCCMRRPRRCWARPGSRPTRRVRLRGRPGLAPARPGLPAVSIDWGHGTGSA